MKYKTGGGVGMHAINENSDQEGAEGRDTYSGDGDNTRVVADYL